jgi:hypothetical protein
MAKCSTPQVPEYAVYAHAISKFVAWRDKAVAWRDKSLAVYQGRDIGFENQKKR